MRDNVPNTTKAWLQVGMKLNPASVMPMRKVPFVLHVLPDLKALGSLKTMSHSEMADCDVFPLASLRNSF